MIRCGPDLLLVYLLGLHLTINIIHKKKEKMNYKPKDDFYRI